MSTIELIGIRENERDTQREWEGKSNDEFDVTNKISSYLPLKTQVEFFAIDYWLETLRSVLPVRCLSFTTLLFIYIGQIVHWSIRNRSNCIETFRFASVRFGLVLFFHYQSFRFNLEFICQMILRINSHKNRLFFFGNRYRPTTKMIKFLLPGNKPKLDRKKRRQ